jgi:hypothetical protein
LWYVKEKEYLPMLDSHLNFSEFSFLYLMRHSVAGLPLGFSGGIKPNFRAHRSAAGDTDGTHLHKDLGQKDH